MTTAPAPMGNGTRVRVPVGVAPWDSGDLYTGDTWTRAFDIPGTYIYFSRFQTQNDMIGTITVR